MNALPQEVLQITSDEVLVCAHIQHTHTCNVSDDAHIYTHKAHPNTASGVARAVQQCDVCGDLHPTHPRYRCLTLTHTLRGSTCIVCTRSHHRLISYIDAYTKQLCVRTQPLRSRICLCLTITSITRITSHITSHTRRLRT